MKIILRALLLLTALLLLAGCQSAEDAGRQDDGRGGAAVAENFSVGSAANTSASQENSQASEDSGQPGMPPGECAARWRCISSTVKAMQQADCSFGQRITCPFGCLNDTCKSAPVCTSGFKCINEHRRGYQTEACTWLNERECPLGCENGGCLEAGNESANATAGMGDAASGSAGGGAEDVESETTLSQEPGESLYALRMGQSLDYTLGETTHEIYLYFLESDRARFEVNGRRGPWLMEGQNHTFPELSITVQNILFQAYAGGVQQVEFMVE